MSSNTAFRADISRRVSASDIPICRHVSKQNQFTAVSKQIFIIVWTRIELDYTQTAPQRARNKENVLRVVAISIEYMQQFGEHLSDTNPSNDEHSAPHSHPPRLIDRR